MHTTLITKIQHCLDLHSFLHTHFPFDTHSDDGWAIHHVAIVVTKNRNYEFLTADDLITRFGFAPDLISDFFEVHHWLYQTHQKQHGCPCQWKVEANALIGEGIHYDMPTLASTIAQNRTHWQPFAKLERAFYHH